MYKQLLLMATAVPLLVTRLEMPRGFAAPSKMTNGLGSLQGLHWPLLPLRPAIVRTGTGSNWLFTMIAMVSLYQVVVVPDNRDSEKSRLTSAYNSFPAKTTSSWWTGLRATFVNSPWLQPRLIQRWGNPWIASSAT